MNTDIKSLADSLKSLNILQITQLLQQISSDLNIDLEKLLSSTTESSNQSASEDKEAIKKKFTLKLIGFDATKQIPMIKAIRELKKDISLIEAKNQLEQLPMVIKTDLLENEVSEMEKEWQKIGAKTQIEEEK